MHAYDAINLFSGADGWGVGAQRLGLDVLGIEFDKTAASTARAAGHVVIEDDVRNHGPAEIAADGLIASPPCQTFSMAGKGAGRAALDRVLMAARVMARRHTVAPVLLGDDPRTALVLEPLRWALEAIDQGHPYRWLAFEQVPTVLPVWEAYAEILRSEGYTVETGYLHAEQYGVPQTRKRAFLVARFGEDVALPEPTHSKYYPRSPEKLDEGVKPWVSMAEALEIPPAEAATLAVRSNYGTGGDPRRRGERLATAPASTITSKADRNLWVPTAANEGTTEADMAWVYNRPSPTIVGSFAPDVVAAPGYRRAGDGPRQKTKGSVRVTLAEAARLQSFPDGYPWQGAKGKKFLQVGNAVPPLLAEAVLAATTRKADA